MKTIILLFCAIFLISCGNDSTKQSSRGSSDLQNKDKDTSELNTKQKHKNISPYVNLLLN